MHLITYILPLLTSLALAAPPPHGYNSTTSISAPSTATATATASASPSNCPVLLENTPWLLTNLTAFDPSPGHNGSFISFHFCDTNPGLELETTCARLLNRFSSKSPVDADTYYACDDETVRFVYAGESLTVKRAFRDDCLGPPPYNHAIAYGKEKLDGVRSTTERGELWQQAELVLEITAMA